MAKLLKLRRGSTSQHASFTGAEGEVTIDTTKDTAVVHDGAQAGGRPLAREDMSNVSSSSIAGQLGTDSIAPSKIAGGNLPTDVKIVSANVVDGTLINADINTSAAIAGTKVSPDFGSQNIATTGTLGSGAITTTGNLTLENANPAVNFIDSGDNPDYQIGNLNGVFRIRDTSSGDNRIVVNNDGHVDITGNLDVGAGLDVTGDITVTGTVDGRDIASLGNKIDGIETGATADQTAAEIRALVQSASDSNVFTDAKSVKLNGIESGATADQTKSDIDGLNINADQVDGLHASSFIRSDTADTASGDITFSGGGGAVTIGSGSDIRFTAGSWTGETTKIQHHNSDLYIQFSSDVRFRNLSGGDICTIDSSGNLVASGNVTAYSDARLKTDISTINDALGIVGKLRGVSYKWLKDGSAGIGVIAQEVEEVIPEVVLTKVNTDPATGTEEEVKSVDYGKIVGVLINAINELKAEVDELKGGK